MSKEPNYILELRQLFEKINSCAEKLSSFDLWDTETMNKINKAEALLRKAMLEIIEVTEADKTQHQ